MNSFITMSGVENVIVVMQREIINSDRTSALTFVDV